MKYSEIDDDKAPYKYIVYPFFLFALHGMCVKRPFL